MITVDKLSFSYYKNETLVDISLEGKPGHISGIIGPNGSGKSTLLKCMAGILKPRKGNIFFQNKTVTEYKKETLAGFVSYLPQKITFNGQLTVFEVILLGRYPFLAWRVGTDDRDAVYEIMHQLGIQHLALRGIHELSGGERQIVFIAQALVRCPKVLLLDEPANNLDLRYQFLLFELLAKITKERNICTFVVMHDINLSAAYSDELIVLNNKTICCSGPPSEVLTETLVESVYGVRTEIRITSDAFPQMTFMRSDNQRNKKKKRRKVNFG
jgi:iron complex transport system ATP-binding protein